MRGDGKGREGWEGVRKKGKEREMERGEGVGRSEGRKREVEEDE